MMKATTRFYAWRRATSAASAKILAAGLFVLVSLSANAQRDIFNWEFSGSFAAVNSGDFELPEEPSLFAAGGRLQLNLGNAWQVGIHAGQFNFGESANLERAYAGLSAAYFWDNGVLLKKRAFITPYHLVEGGIFGRAEVEDPSNPSFTEQSSAVGLENGLKFRFGDRITFHVAYAVYRELDSRGFEETFGNNGLSLWKAGLSYHFGAKKVNYSGPVFDASSRFEKSRFASSDIRPLISLPGVEPGPADTVRPKDFYLPMPERSEPVMISGVDTIINFYVDTTLATRIDTVIHKFIDTNYVTSVDTAFTFRVDSVRGNVLDTNFTNITDTVMTPRVDTTFAAITDTVFTVRPDTVFRPWSRPADTEYIRDRSENPQEEKSDPVPARSDEAFAELRDRVAYLEGLVAGFSRRDTIITIREDRVEQQPAKAEEQKVVQKIERAPAEQKEPEKAFNDRPQENPQDQEKTERAGPRSSADPTSTQKSESPTYKTDPAVVAMMQRQEELMKTQNALLREMSGKNSQVSVEAAPRERRPRVDIAPTVAVPVGGGGRDRADQDRIEKLEQEVASLKAALENRTAHIDSAGVDSSRVDSAVASARVDVSAQVTDNTAETDSIGPDTAATTETTLSAEEQKRDSLNAAVEAIQQKADSIVGATAEKAARREDTEKVAATRKDSIAETAPELAPTAPKLTASYPAVFKFGLNRDDVGADYDEVFDKVATDLKANPDASANIVGFTDRSGNPEYNRQLSERRAKNIKRRLTERGVPAEKLVIRGEGESAGDDKWNAGDRRVEVTILF